MSALKYGPKAISVVTTKASEASMPVVTITESPFDANITAKIIGDSSGEFFKVVRIVRYQVARAIPGGWPVGEMTDLADSDGITPLAVARGDVIEVTMLFTAPKLLSVHSAELAVSAQRDRHGGEFGPGLWGFQVPLTIELRKPDFWITGIEAIQSVQTPDNGVPLIGHKPTYVRAYVQSDVGMNITGVLRATDAGGRVRQISASAPSVTATPEGSQRGLWSQSINFRLDDDLTSAGTLDIVVALFDPVIGPESNPQANHVETRQLQFSQRIDLRVFGVIWSVKNNDDNQGAPIGPAAPWSDFEIHRVYVENVFPVSTFTIDPLPGVGMQAPNPQPFNNLTESRTWASKTLKGLPAGSTINLLDNWDFGGLHGLANFDGADRTSEEQNARDIRAGTVMAQEIAHALGLHWHTFTPGTPYPRDDGTIGSDEICLDLTGPQPVLHLGSLPTYDIMSYGNRGSPPPKHWASAFTYGALFAAINT